MLKWVLLGVFGLILAFAGSLAYRLGVFKQVSVEINDQPQFILLGLDHTGPYHKIVESLNEVENWAKAHDINCSQTFGQFLDDPEMVEEGRLRAFVGCVISRPDKERVDKAGPDLIQEAAAKGLHTKILYSGRYVVGQFTGSPSIGPFKVYPKIKKLIFESRLKPQSWNLEIYHILGPDAMSTTYLFPLQ